eukprot:c19597_g1_i1 orf=293-988(+)
MASNGPSTNELDLIYKNVEQQFVLPFGTQPQVPLPTPIIIVISGSSGVGKDAVIKKLLEVRPGLHFVVTATTRPKRPGEVHGKDYIFVSKEEFESMIQKNELLEHAVVYGDYKGIPKKQILDSLARGMDVLLRLDIQGVATIRKILGSNAIYIYLVAESEAALVKRLIQRGTETKDKLVLRIATAREELKHLDEYDYVVVNADGQLDKAVSMMCSIIDAEKARVHRGVACL